MTDEDRQRTMDFILAQQAQFSANMDALRETQARTDETVSRLSKQVEQLSIQVGQLTTQVELNARQQSHINEVVAVIADAQQHTDERLNALIDIVQQGRNGKG
ncbi:MAG: sigma-S stabilization anti-adapter protein IraP [Pyrinomonadaceae bacterium]